MKKSKFWRLVIQTTILLSIWAMGYLILSERISSGNLMAELTGRQKPVEWDLTFMLNTFGMRALGIFVSLFVFVAFFLNIFVKIKESLLKRKSE